MIVFLIFLSFWLGLSISSALIALTLVAIVFLLFIFKRFNKKLGIICLTSLAVGFAYSFVHISYNNKTSFQGIVYAAKENYILFNSGGERLYVYSKNNSYDVGDILTIQGEKEELSFDTLESSFNFTNYLKKKGVYHSLKIKTIKVNFHNFIRIKERREKLLNQFNEEERNIIGAILFSDSGYDELTTNIRNLHLARFLGASGVFISVFYFALRSLFAFFLKDKYAELTSLGLLSLYGVFTFPRFSVIKVLLLLTIRWINNYILKNKFSYLTIIGSLGISCLLLNHFLANQDCFILGFLIPIISYLTRYIGGKNKIKRCIYRYLIIYLFFLPFEVMYYNKIVILSLPLQIISTPLFMIIGVVSLLCFFYVPIYSVDKFFINGLSYYVSFIKPLSFGPLLPDLNQGIIIVYYCLYFLFLYYASHGFVPLTKTFMLAQISFLVILAVPIDNFLTNEVNFIYVGQGDCTLIRNKDKVALIDTGGSTYKDVANDSLIPYLKKKKIYKIDLVIITHYDYDHYGALSELNKTYSIKNIADYRSSFPISLGELTFNNYNYYASDKQEENDKSLVISFRLCQKDFIICGDAPSSIEKKIIMNEKSLPCDILKVGHHGSNTSTCEEWIRFTNPKEAIVSCGKNNKFGHPNKEVITILNKYHIKIRRTDIEGTIKYQSIFN